MREYVRQHADNRHHKDDRLAKRRILFLLPLILVLPLFFGIDGDVYAGPVADGAVAVLAALLVWREMRKITDWNSVS